MTDYAISKFHFQVKWGTLKMGFMELSGLNGETSAIDYRECSNKKFSKKKMPGRASFNTVTLKRGVAKMDNNFKELTQSLADNTIKPQDLTIILLNESQEPVAEWRAVNAVPFKIQSPGLHSEDNGVAIESMEISYEGIELIS